MHGGRATGSNSAEQAPETRRRPIFTLTLLAIAAISLIPRLALGTSQFVEYDGYWHVWIAQQDRWANFIREYHGDAHPPLYYLLLRWTMALGNSQVVYRLLSLISGTISVWFLGITALKAFRSPIWAALSALAYGLSMASILTSNEVRGYMLASFFIQVSFYYLLDLIGERQPPTLWPRIVFALMAVLACLTEYYALIYVAAAFLIVLANLIFLRPPRLVFAILREAATFVLILALPVWEYISHLGAKSVAYDHLPGYYFPADGSQSVADFLWSNLRNELSWFSPLKLPEGGGFAALIAVCVAALLATVFLLRDTREPKNREALMSLAFPFVILGALMAGGLVRAYPYGGFLRQQYIIYPFLIVCPFLLADRLLTGVRPLVTRVLAGLVAILIAFVSIQDYEAWPKISRLLLSDQMARYNRLFPAAEAVYIDQFNLITFFTHHHTWKWTYVSPLPENPGVDIYRLSEGPRSILLFRDLNHWLLDFREADMYALIARGMRQFGVRSMTIFCPAQFPGKPRTRLQTDAYRARIAELGAAQGLCVQTLELENYDVYAEFRSAGGCSAAPSGQ
jgi:hypothetical protein